MDAPGYILISRADSIGDVVLTLPVARYLKQHFPGARIGFIGRSYTRAVIEACRYVDVFIDKDDFLSAPHPADAILHVFPVKEIAQKARAYGIPLRIGTRSRLYHWFTCNRLVKLSRKNSPWHEAQLNLRLLEGLGISVQPSLEELGADLGLAPVAELDASLAALLDPERFNLVLHPCSQGSAREWGTDHFIRLTQLLDERRVKIFVSGTAAEQPRLQPLLDAAGDRVTDLSGKMSLPQLIAFISRAGGLVANSTGPLHIAGALGRYAFGIYPPIRPMHPGRWAPLGAGARVFVLPRDCSDCRSAPASCHCIKAIQPAEVAAAVMAAAADRK